MGKITAGVGSTKKAGTLRMRYRIARMSLLIATVFGALNPIFLFFDNVNFYSPFACMFPYGIMWDGMFWTGQLYSSADYQAYFGLTAADMLHPDYLFVLGALAALAVIAFAVCWVLSGRYVAALVVGTVLMVLDTVALFWFFDVSLVYLAEYAMRVLLLVILIMGIVAHYRLQFMRWMGEETTVPLDADGMAAHPDTPALHTLDFSDKGKIIMIYDIEGYTVCYRKVGRICELAINKMVYDTVDTGAYEQPHELCAYVDGHEFVVGTGADAQAFIRLDGEVIRKKQR